MKKSILMLLTMSLVASFVMTDCKKDKTSDSPADLPKPSISNGAPVKVPDNFQNSQQPGAQICAGYLMTVNSLTSWENFFIVPANAQELKSATLKSTGTRSYKWSNGSETVYYEYTETSDKYTWTIYFQDATHPKSKALYCEEQKTGKGGKVEVYEETDGSIDARWTWTKDNSNNIDFIYEEPSTSSVIEIKANADGSGSLKATEDNFLKYEGSWNTQGHGTLIFHNDNGDTTLTF